MKLLITLKKLMARHGDDASSLAAKSGVSISTNYRFLSGKHKTVSDPTVQKWADAYHVTVEQLKGKVALDEYLRGKVDTKKN